MIFFCRCFTLALNSKVQAMVAETDPQVAVLGFKTDASKVDNKNALNMQLVKCVITVPCIK